MTQICVVFAFGRRLAMVHGLNIAIVKFDVVFALCYRNAVQYAFINHNLGCV